MQGRAWLEWHRRDRLLPGPQVRRFGGVWVCRAQSSAVSNSGVGDPQRGDWIRGPGQSFMAHPLPSPIDKKQTTVACRALRVLLVGLRMPWYLVCFGVVGVRRCLHRIFGQLFRRIRAPRFIRRAHAEGGVGRRGGIWHTGMAVCSLWTLPAPSRCGPLMVGTVGVL